MRYHYTCLPGSHSSGSVPRGSGPPASRLHGSELPASIFPVYLHLLNREDIWQIRIAANPAGVESEPG